MKLTPDQVRIISEYNLKKEFLDKMSQVLHDEYDPFFEEIMSHNDLQLDTDAESCVVQSYYQFELRRRIRALGKL